MSPTIAPVAIVGIGCRFPGADGPDAFWRLLAEGIDAIREVPSERWSSGEFYDDDPAAPGRMSTRWGGFLTDVDRFDAAFFGISAREAAHVDPQQRILIEVAWEALEDAGLSPQKLAGQRVGVFVGMSSFDYGHLQFAHPDEIRDGYGITGSALSIGANRLSYFFDFRGPSVVIDTACSSSLVAIYDACQSLNRGESPVALAGGVNLILSPAVTIGFSKLQAMAPDGRCKAFDARADGFVRGEGAGIVVLKPLADALSDGDRIYAVIRGGAINQDGRTNGLTAPNGRSQEALLREAFSNAGVSPAEMHYFEAHGTGTALGDPIELNALGAVLAAGRAREARCAVGSVKTNIGHLEAAAGVAGLIKLALSIERRRLPPSLHFKNPNPYIRFDVLPLRVVTQLEPWPFDAELARGGVSAFGFGGTNAHLVLEGAPPRVPRARSRKDEACILPISTRSEAALSSLARAFAGRLTEGDDHLSLVDLCATAAARRNHHDYRLAAVASSGSEMAAMLGSFLEGGRPRGLETGRRIASRRRKMAFVFPGHGSQWLGMGKELARCEPAFRASIETCAAAISDHVDWSLTAELDAAQEHSRLDEVDVIQPVMFAIQVALGDLWRSWGIRPDAVVGHSMGEVAAAYMAGALSLSDAARVICARGRLAKRASGRGAMVMVEIALEEALATLAGYEGRLGVAACNSPTSVVLSGDSEALAEVVEGLERREVFCRRVKIDYASHSPHMDPLKAELLSALEGLAPQRSTVPFYSTVTGAIASGPDLGPAYWVRNLREPVLFAPAIERLLHDGIDVFLEVSPHPILLSAIQQCLAHLKCDATLLASLRRDESEQRSLLSTLASLYAIGKPVEWSVLYPPGGECVSLPTYPWQREHFWFDDEGGTQTRRTGARVKANNPLIGEHIRSASGTVTHLWQRDLSVESLPFLKDHRVRGNVTVSPMVYLEMALEAAGQALPAGASCAFENLRFDEPLVLAEGKGRQVQVVLTRQVPTRFEWQVFAEIPGPVADGASTFSKHACGQLRVLPSQEGCSAQAAVLADIRVRCTTEITGGDHYRRLANLDLDRGPSFQTVDAVWMGDGEAVGRLRPLAGGRPYHVHPALLDSSVQILVAAAARCFEAQEPLVPVSVDHFRLHSPTAGSGPMWVHVWWKTERSRLRGDARLLGDTGDLVAEIRGITLGPVEGSVARPRDGFYTVAWDKQPAAVRTTDEGRKGRSFLLFGDSLRIGSRLAEAIAQRGGRAILVAPGAALHIPDNSSEATPCLINPGSGEDYRLLMEGLSQSAITVDHVVHLWGLDIGADAIDGPSPGWRSGLLLTQALAGNQLSAPPRLWFITRGAQAVLQEEDVSPLQAPIWGLARTVMQEHPELLCTVVDMSASPTDREFLMLMDELWSPEGEQEIAVRSGDRFVARLTRHDPQSVRLTQPADSQQDGPPRPFRAQLDELGNLQSICLRHMTRRRPSPGEVEIQVVSAGLNVRDVLAASAFRPADGEDIVLGRECAGRIASIGEGVAGWVVGDEVVALAKLSPSSFVRTPASLVARKPRRLDFDEAATEPVTFFTAYYALNHLARLQPGERVLIHSAAGAVGLAFLRLAREVGAEIFATAGTTDKRRLLESLGVRMVMDSRSLSFEDDVMAATGGEGVDVVVNSLPGEALVSGLALLRPGGRFLELGRGDPLEGGQIPLRSLQEGRSFFLIDVNSLAARRPDTCGRLFHEALTFFEDRELTPIATTVFPATKLNEALQQMAGGLHIGNIVIRMDQADVAAMPPADVPNLIRDDATYVVTGGLGGIALVASQWLVENGARHLVLVGRSRPSPRALDVIAAMERAGARVLVDRFDVADAASVNAAFARWVTDLPPVRGVMHAAGVLDDGILLQQSAKRFETVMAPKVAGAWNLHRASLECPVDFFVLFSSAASILGSAGQSNYAAANHFMDALAHHRRAHNLPAVSINWGPWSEVGLAARRDPHGRLELGGMKSLSPKQGLEALGQALLGDAPQIAVMHVDWGELRAAYPLLTERPFFSRVRGGAAEPASEDPIRAQLLTAPVERRAEMLAERLRLHAAGVLRLAPSKVDIDQPLFMMGIDSLMAVELKIRVERELGVAIPLLQLVKGPSLSELARSLLGSITGEAVPTADKAESEAEARAGTSLLVSLLSLKDGQRP